MIFSGLKLHESKKPAPEIENTWKVDRLKSNTVFLRKQHNNKKIHSPSYFNNNPFNVSFHPVVLSLTGKNKNKIKIVL